MLLSFLYPLSSVRSASSRFAVHVVTPGPSRFLFCLRLGARGQVGTGSVDCILFAASPENASEGVVRRCHFSGLTLLRIMTAYAAGRTSRSGRPFFSQSRSISRFDVLQMSYIVQMRLGRVSGETGGFIVDG